MNGDFNTEISSRQTDASVVTEHIDRVDLLSSDTNWKTSLRNNDKVIASSIAGYDGSSSVTIDTGTLPAKWEQLKSLQNVSNVEPINSFSERFKTESTNAQREKGSTKVEPERINTGTIIVDRETGEKYEVVTILKGAGEGILPTSHYGENDGFDGKETASGETFDKSQFTTANKFLPFDTMVVLWQEDGQAAIVRVNDRGPYSGGRQFDVASDAAKNALPLLYQNGHTDLKGAILKKI